MISSRDIVVSSRLSVGSREQEGLWNFMVTMFKIYVIGLWLGSFAPQVEQRPEVYLCPFAEPLVSPQVEQVFGLIQVAVLHLCPVALPSVAPHSQVFGLVHVAAANLWECSGFVGSVGLSVGEVAGSVGVVGKVVGSVVGGFVALDSSVGAFALSVVALGRQTNATITIPITSKVFHFAVKTFEIVLCHFSIGKTSNAAAKKIKLLTEGRKGRHRIINNTVITQRKMAFKVSDNLFITIRLLYYCFFLQMR